jgi:hypothetical protein
MEVCDRLSSLYSSHMTNIECAYCATSMFICLNVFLIYVIGNFSFFSSKIFIDGICVVALAPVVRTMSGAMFHLLDTMLLMSG